MWEGLRKNGGQKVIRLEMFIEYTRPIVENWLTRYILFSDKLFLE